MTPPLQGEKNYHDILHVCMKPEIPQPEDQSLTYRNFKAVTQTALLNFLTGCDWTSLKRAADLDIETAVNTLGNNLTGAIKALA